MKRNRMLNYVSGSLEEENVLNILVNDNGPGLPEGTNLAKLTEPYVTFKEKGTGLGLAIVKENYGRS